MGDDKFISLSIGKRLRDIRKRKGVDGPHLLSHLMEGRYSPSAILRRETGKLRISFDYLESFCDALKLEGQEREDVLTVARLDLWRSKRSIVDLTREFHELKFKTKTHQKFVATLIPGEFQTLNYAKAVLNCYEAGNNSTEERAKIRIEANQKLLSDESKIIEIILTEYSFYKCIGSQEIMLEQMGRLREIKENAQVSFRILPERIFLTIPNWESFYIMDRKYCFCETRIGMITAEDENVINDLLLDFKEIWNAAVSGEERNNLINKAIEYYKSL